VFHGVVDVLWGFLASFRLGERLATENLKLTLKNFAEAFYTSIFGLKGKWTLKK
jgi:hypothetical protein